MPITTHGDEHDPCTRLCVSLYELLYICNIMFKGRWWWLGCEVGVSREGRWLHREAVAVRIPYTFMTVKTRPAEESSGSAIWKWTLTKESIAPCFVRDVLNMRSNDEAGAPFVCDTRRTIVLNTRKTLTFFGWAACRVAASAYWVWSSGYRCTKNEPFIQVI
jgi:hypothetical protein